MVSGLVDGAPILQGIRAQTMRPVTHEIHFFSLLLSYGLSSPAYSSVERATENGVKHFLVSVLLLT